jgi:parallel beta-helix repeat protein
MTPLTDCLRKSIRKFAQLFAAWDELGRPAATPKWQLEQLESREVPATYYVAPTGADSAVGDSTNPWQTLQHAAAVVQAGDTVVVRAGTYAGFQITTSGTAANPIVFDADPGVLVNDRHPAVSAYAGAINLEGASHVVIDGFTVTMATYGTVRSSIRSVANTGAVIRNNVIDNASWWGIFTGFSEDVRIENNRVTNTAIEHGIYVGNSADNPVIRGNYVANARGAGIQINSDAEIPGGDGVITNALVENNTLVGNTAGKGAAINFDGVQDSVIRNNLILGTVRNGIALHQTDGAGGARNNAIVGNTIVFQPGVGYYAVSIASGTEPSSGNKVFDNILYREVTATRGSIAVDSWALAGFQSDYNVVVDRFNLSPYDENLTLTLAQWRAQTGQDLHSIVATPGQLFVDPANNDYRLKVGSPAINAGTNLTQLPTDISGVARPGAVTGPDSTPPTVSGVSPGNGSRGVPLSAPLTATFSEDVDPATITFLVTDPFDNVVPGSLRYDATDIGAYESTNPATRHTPTFTPTAPLLPLTDYTVTLSGVKDRSGNAMAAVAWSFKTCGVWAQTGAADFATGSHDGTMVTDDSGGAVTLVPLLHEEFTAALRPSNWTTQPWASVGGGSPTIGLSGGVLTVGGLALMSIQSSTDTAVEGRINFAAAAWQHFGLTTSYYEAYDNYWAMFSTRDTTDRLFALVNADGWSSDVDLGPRPTGFHTYRVVPTGGAFEFYVDGTLRATIAGSFQGSVPLKVGLSDFTGTPGQLLRADWISLKNYSTTRAGTFTSTVFDAGGPVTWDRVSLTASVPTGTTLTLSVRVGTRQTDGSILWRPAVVLGDGRLADEDNNPILGQYLQYTVTMATTDSTKAPRLDDISFMWL